MKILVTGGAGFVGSHLVKTLLARGDQVVSYGKLKETATYSVDNDFSTANLVIINGDITDVDAVIKSASINRPDVVVHTAAITGIKTCLDNPKESFNVNVYGTFNVVEACIKTGSRLVFISSREVYGETVGDATVENSMTLPNNLYGITKLLGENIIINSQRKHNLNCSILRFTNIYGPGGDKYGIQILIRKALAGEKIQILGGEQTMNLIHVEDVVRSILACIDDKRSIGQIFNVGSYDNISVNHIVRKIVQTVGKGNPIEQKPCRETETFYFKPDISKISAILGWTPRISLNDGLLSTIEWYQKSERTLLS
jgi:UDP-glucose 4-epimerase